jgi:hypothetical protein
MKARIACAVVTLLLGFAVWRTPIQQNSVSAHAGAPAKGGFDAQELSRFIALEPIDTHTHIYESEPSYFAMLRKLHLHTLDIMVVSDNANPERKDLAKESKNVLRWSRKAVAR